MSKNGTGRKKEVEMGQSFFLPFVSVVSYQLNQLKINKIVGNPLNLHNNLLKFKSNQRKLGKVGLTIMERVFGIILIAIGMKILINALVLSINYANSML